MVQVDMQVSSDLRARTEAADKLHALSGLACAEQN